MIYGMKLTMTNNFNQSYTMYWMDGQLKKRCLMK